MKCRFCGAEIPNDSAFCEECGRSLTDSDQQTPDMLPKSRTEPLPQASENPTKINLEQPAGINSEQIDEVPSQQPVPSIQNDKETKRRHIITVAAAVIGGLAIVFVALLAIAGFFIPKGINGAVIQPQKIYEDDIVSVQIKDLSYQGYYEPYRIGVKITNKTGVELSIHPRNVKINDRNVGYLGGGAHINPRETDEAQFSFKEYDIYHLPIRNVKKFEFELWIYGKDNGEIVHDYYTDPVTIYTSLAD